MSFADSIRPLVTSVLPESTLQRIRARRRASAFREAGVAFIHVPRAAGTSVAEALYGGFIGHFGVRDLIAAAPKDVLALPRFAIARNPWDRAVSAWSFAKAGGGTSAGGGVRVARAGRYAIAAFDTFESFVTEWLAVRDPEGLDGIFRPQVHYLLDRDGQLALDHLGRLDRIGETQEWLSDTLGRHIVIAHENASPRSDYRDYYTPETRDLVARIYARDIALLGAEF